MNFFLLRERNLVFFALISKKKKLLERVFFCLLFVLSVFALKKKTLERVLEFFSRFCFIFYSQESHTRRIVIVISNSSSSIQER